MIKLGKIIESKKGAAALLVILIALALFVRLPELQTVIPATGTDSAKIFWYDETLSLSYAQQSWGDFWRVTGFDASPPLFYLMLWVWFWRFGFSGVTLLRAEGDSKVYVIKDGKKQWKRFPTLPRRPAESGSRSRVISRSDTARSPDHEDGERGAIAPPSFDRKRKVSG